ncbi:hypothetical protein E2320_021804 [Naja naja]|nr:hypothetical protein E2320_021804 [Naja naja]
MQGKERERERERETERREGGSKEEASERGSAAVVAVVVSFCRQAPSVRPSWPMLYQRVLLPRVPQWAIRSHLNSPVSLHKPGQPPVPGITPQVLLLQLHPVCLLAHRLPTCLLDRHQQECILPSRLGHQFLFLLLVLLVLQVLHIHPLVLPHQGNIHHQTCPSQRFQGHMGVPPNQVLPLLLLEHGDPCPLEVGEPQLGDNILHLVCHIHLQGHIPLPLRLQGLLLQCHGVLSPQDHGDLRLLAHILHQQDPIQLQGCTQRHLILTKCHLRLLEHHPYLVVLIPTVELVAG